MSLKSATISNIKWSFVESISLKAISFVLGIILARLLMPEDFGLLAVVNVFYLLVTLFIDGGLKEALVQKKDATEVHYSSVFWLNLGMGIALYLLLFTIAPFIEQFYNYENLAYYIRLQSLTLIIESFGLVQIAKATKELNLKKITKARIPASLISFGVGIFMAYNGYGILSLIVQQLVNTFLYVVFLVVSIRYKPQLLFDRKAAGVLYGFGLKILGMSLISRFYVQSLNLIYAKFFTPHLLGLNNKANTIQVAPIEIINATFMKGVYPSMVVLQNNIEKLRQLFLVNVKILTYLMLLVNGILFFKAEDIIILLLGENWIETVIYLKIVALGSLFSPITVQSQNIFKVKNLLSFFLKMELFNKLLSLGLVFFLVSRTSFPFVLGVVFGINVIFSFIYLYIVSRSLKISYLRESGLILFTTTALLLIGLGVNWFLEFFVKNVHLMVDIGFFVIVYSVVYICVIFIFDKKLIHQLKTMLKYA